MSGKIRKFLQTSPLYGSNAAYLEDQYDRYLQDPSALPAHWRAYFDDLQAGRIPHAALPAAPSISARTTATRGAAGFDALAAQKQTSVLQLINAYRVRGHQQAQTDWVLCEHREEMPDLEPAFHNLDEADFDTEFNTGSLFAPPRMRLRDILALLQKVYTGTIGAEYMHITDTEQKRWIQERLESNHSGDNLSGDARRRLLQRLTAAEGLERYLHTKYVGQKRFSLEGGESLIPMLDQLIVHGGENGIKEVVIGMAHRGRLNVLVNTLGKDPCNLFQEFEGSKLPADGGSGDVKYHMGFSADTSTPGGNLHVALAFNPSHLEIIAPVVEGSVRARQQRRDDKEGKLVLPVIIHGDSAFAGQGVVMENFNMSQSRGYGTGGTVHIVVNNRIGFTTSNPLDTRSSLYCTDVAKMVQAPIFHVNGDDPEAVLFVANLALDYRVRFHRDVVIDLVCYRRHGHNEADEPAATQPLMYQRIRAHPTTRELYATKLIEQGLLDETEVERMREEYRDSLEQCSVVSPHSQEGAKYAYGVEWKPYQNVAWDTPVDTAISQTLLQDLAARLQQLPEGFEVHPRTANIMADRRKMAAGALPLDWGFAETMAYASLVEQGYPIRLSGQDSGRGTFFHRHAVLHNQLDDSSHTPLQHLSSEQGNFIVIDSVLSEEAVLAFEYGYSSADPHCLTIWEAQFGDFANGAQVVIDQFISSGEMKWNRLCGLTLFLPHGYEGQGAEHSSARLERFLQLCAERNMQVCVPSTPAQMFHMLRRQMLRPYRKPLIVMTPKSLLRHPLSVSRLEDLCAGGFQPVIGEADDLKKTEVKRIVMCCGKVYYDLLKERREHAIEDTALIRIEQLYPFPADALATTLAAFRQARDIVWCQEEPKNQGAWYQSQHHFRDLLRKGQQLRYAGRAASAAPAVGHFQLHLEQQRALVRDALGIQAEQD